VIYFSGGVIDTGVVERFELPLLKGVLRVEI